MGNWIKLDINYGIISKEKAEKWQNRENWKINIGNSKTSK